MNIRRFDVKIIHANSKTDWMVALTWASALIGFCMIYGLIVLFYPSYVPASIACILTIVAMIVSVIFYEKFDKQRLALLKKHKQIKLKVTSLSNYTKLNRQNHDKGSELK